MPTKFLAVGIEVFVVAVLIGAAFIVSRIAEEENQYDISKRSEVISKFCKWIGIFLIVGHIAGLNMLMIKVSTVPLRFALEVFISIILGLIWIAFSFLVIEKENKK